MDGDSRDFDFRPYLWFYFWKICSILTMVYFYKIIQIFFRSTLELEKPLGNVSYYFLLIRLCKAPESAGSKSPGETRVVQYPCAATPWWGLCGRLGITNEIPTASHIQLISPVFLSFFWQRSIYDDSCDLLRMSFSNQLGSGQASSILTSHLCLSTINDSRPVCSNTIPHRLRKLVLVKPVRFHNLAAELAHSALSTIHEPEKSQWIPKIATQKYVLITTKIYSTLQF